MKKILTTMMLCILMIGTCFTTVNAASDYDLFYDGLDFVDSSYAYEIGYTTLAEFSDEHHVELRVDIVPSTEGHTVCDYAGIFIDQYDYGYGDTKDGILLMLHFDDNTEDIQLIDYCVQAYGENLEQLNSSGQGLSDLVQTYISAGIFDSQYEDDVVDIQTLINAYIEYAQANVPIISSSSTVNVDDNSVEFTYVADLADILTDEQELEFVSRAASISEKYQCNIYIATVDDYRNYSRINVE